MDDLDVYESIGRVCIDCHLPYDLCNCPPDYVEEDEYCPTKYVADSSKAVAICPHCGHTFNVQSPETSG